MCEWRLEATQHHSRDRRRRSAGRRHKSGLSIHRYGNQAGDPVKRLAKLVRSRSSEEGSALVLALIVIMVVGITVGALLSFAGSGLAIAPKERALRNQTNY